MAMAQNNKIGLDNIKNIIEKILSVRIKVKLIKEKYIAVKLIIFVNHLCILLMHKMF